LKEKKLSLLNFDGLSAQGVGILEGLEGNFPKSSWTSKDDTLYSLEELLQDEHILGEQRQCLVKVVQPDANDAMSPPNS
jgi:hypothetical protein